MLMITDSSNPMSSRTIGLYIPPIGGVASFSANEDVQMLEGGMTKKIFVHGRLFCRRDVLLLLGRVACLKSFAIQFSSDCIVS